MNPLIEFMKFTGLPGLFAFVGIYILGRLNYEAIKHFIETWPPQTFLNGAEIFCFIPFLTFGTLMYIGLLYVAVTGKLSEKDND